MNIIRYYEQRYISRQEFFNHLWGSGQQLINEEGEDRFAFYIALAAGYHQNNYYIIRKSEADTR